MTMSICTLGHGRDAHLVNLVNGLVLQTTMPSELIVAVMDETAYRLPEAPFPIRQIVMGSTGLTLSAARNAAARSAQSERIAFLDIDCIPTPTFVADYADRLGEQDAVIMGEVLYLPKGATENGLDFDAFARIAQKHSERAGPPLTPLGPCSDYRCFWSLNFAMRRDTFLAIGGFDEAFSGYGGEDTDFGRTFVEAGIPLLWCQGALAYHQYHPHHMPPVHHIDSVLANARRFRAKWGHFTMEHWLRAFELMGLIAKQGSDYIRLRETGPQDLAMTAQQSHEPYASSARVLKSLEAQASGASAAAIA